MEYFKTSISIQKLYEKNYTRDAVTKVKVEDAEHSCKDIYVALADILTMKYLDYKKS